jgi:pimeloyl-ACP methyl ester carboxylesterase
VTSATRARSFAEREAGGLHVVVGGDGPPAVLLHGLAGAAQNWLDVAALLAPDHHVVAPDLPGHGGSPPLRARGIDAFADTVARTLEELETGPAQVAGHSFGAHVALALAARRPDLVRALLLVAPSGIETRRRVVRLVVLGSAVLRPGARVAPLARRFADRPWFRQAVFRPWYVSDAAAFSARATRAFLSQLPAHTGLRAAARAMLDDDPRFRLKHVTCPTLLLWGARDAQVPLRDGFELARRLRAPIRSVADCGHLLIGERPDAVVDALRALSASPSPSPAS